MHKEQEKGGVSTHLSQVEARAGSRTRVTRNILVVSLILIVALFIIAVGTGFLSTHNSGADSVTPDNTARNTTQAP